MIIHELMKMTTLGPFHAETDATVQCDDGFEIANCQTGMGEAHDVAAARMFAHCCNNYMKALDLLKRTQERYEDFRCIKCCTTDCPGENKCFAEERKLIAELEEVPE